MVKLPLTVVGVRHHVTISTIREMAKDCPIKAKIEREPDNLHDENALAVIVLEKPQKGMKIGYIPRQTAAELSARIDAGQIEFVEAWLTEVDAESGVGELMTKVKKLKIPGNKRISKKT